MIKTKKIKNYLSSSISEVGKITWPTRAETKSLTYLVIAVAILASIYLAIFDNLFERGLEWLLELNG